MNSVCAQNRDHICTDVCGYVYNMKLDIEHEGHDNSVFTFELEDWKAAIEGRLDAIRDCTGGRNVN